MITKGLKEYKFGTIDLDSYLDYSCDINTMADFKMSANFLFEASEVYSPCAIVCTPMEVRENSVNYYVSGKELLTALILDLLAKRCTKGFKTYFTKFAETYDLTGNITIEYIKDFSDAVVMSLKFKDSFGKVFMDIDAEIKEFKEHLLKMCELLESKMPLKSAGVTSDRNSLRFFTKSLDFHSPIARSKTIILNCSDFCAPLYDIKSTGNLYNRITEDDLQKILDMVSSKSRFSELMIESSLFFYQYPVQLLLAELIYKELN